MLKLSFGNFSLLLAASQKDDVILSADAQPQCHLVFDFHQHKNVPFTYVINVSMFCASFFFLYPLLKVICNS